MFLTPDQLTRELYLQPGSHVADFGCGTGVYALTLARAVGNTGQVYAVDVHRDLLHTLAGTLERQQLLNVDIVWANIEEEVPIEKYSLDAIILSNVLFQVEKPVKVLEIVRSLLKPEGQVLVVDWSDSHKGVGPRPHHVLSEAKAEELFLVSGFRLQKRLPAGDYHYAFIAISV